MQVRQEAVTDDAGSGCQGFWIRCSMMAPPKWTLLPCVSGLQRCWIGECWTGTGASGQVTISSLGWGSLFSLRRRQAKKSPPQGRG